MAQYGSNDTLSLEELKPVCLFSGTGPGGLRIERDRYFRPAKTLQAYADEASHEQRIVA